MKIVDRFLNRSEQIAFAEIAAVANDNGLRAFPKSRLCDVLVKGDDRLTDRVFGYYTRAHFDFVITDHEFRPFMAVEYDGPYHVEDKQAERDAIKNELCKTAALRLLRIGAKHVTQKFRGMTLLRWIVEVSQLQIAFDEAQANGHIPYDEPFDPAMMYGMTGVEKKWPYWLSHDANIRINRFIRSQSGTKAWVTLRGTDAQDNDHSFSYLRTGDEFLYVKTATRSQGAGIPSFDMLDQITGCELDEELSRFQRGETRMVPLTDFKNVHDRICRKYRMQRSGWMGAALDIGNVGSPN